MRRIPAQRWGAIWLVVAIGAIGGVIGLELFVRSRGYQPSIKDDEYAWTWNRIAASRGETSHTVAVLGASRILLALDPDTFRAAAPGYEPVMLAINGTTSLGTLRDLANDERFHGIVVADVDEHAFYREAIANQDAYLRVYHRRWRAPGALAERFIAHAPAVLQHLTPAHCWRGRVLREHDDMAQRREPRVRPRAQSRHDRAQQCQVVHGSRALGEDHGHGVGLAEDVGHVLGAKARVDGDEDCADLHDGEHRVEPLGPIDHPEGHPVPGRDAELKQALGSGVDARAQLGEGEALIAERTARHQSFYREGVEAEFFDPNNAEELITKVRDLLADAPRREAMREAGRQALQRQHHTYRDRLERLLEIHQQAKRATA